MRNLAIIPARGGSKRLPRKNVLPFQGKPMLTWTAEAARDSGLFERVLISTEDAEIAAISRQYGFEAIPRPEHLATDEATCAQVCLHVLDELEKQGEMFDILCCLYATAPLRGADDIAGTMRLLGDNAANMADFAFAVTSYPQSPYQMLIPDSVGFLIPAWPLIANQKSQALPCPFIDNGSTYAVRVPAFRTYKSFHGPRLRGYSMSRMHSIDIDTAEDLEMALWAAEWLRRGEKR